MKTTSKKSAKDTLSIGSALILAVVLTSLLAIIGVMFIMIARVDKMATSAISENKELNFAVETVVALVSQELVLDVPGMPKGQEYYDYPDTNNAWLASLEPYDSGGYKWRQISDIYNRLGANDLRAEIIADYQQNIAEDVSADADGDGVADSKWVKLDDITSNKGKPIYAAIRVVDNGAMLNVNTAYKFDPNAAGVTAADIDGSSQMQLNLAAFARTGCSNPDTIDGLADARNPLGRPLSDYLDGLIWRIEDPCSGYLPFDISDELTIRGRYIIKQNDTITRLKKVWECAFDGSVGYTKYTPYTATGDLQVWFDKAYRHPSDASRQQYYNMPHISTTYNIDRIIDPDCNNMTNINKANAYSIYRAVKSALDPNFVDANGVAAQIAVNLVDFRDGATDPNVTTLDVNGITYYGFKRPCVYISELAYRFVKLTIGAPIDTLFRKSYAIELYKPYPEDNYPELNQWRLNIQGYGTVDVNWSGTKHFHVIYLEDSCAPLPPVIFGSSDSDPDFPLRPYVQTIPIGYNTTITSVSLERLTGAGWISVDSTGVPGWLTPTPPGGVTLQSMQRDITLHKCIRRLWASSAGSPDLGFNAYVDNTSPLLIQAHPADSDFNNVGEIGMLFRKSAYEIGSTDTETTARLNLADPCYQNLFQYLTKFDPNADGIDNDGDGTPDNGELKVPGRININTAPWYVLAQLPWVSQRVGYNNTALAQAIVAYRDKLNLSSAGGPDYSSRSGAAGFESIGELMNVAGMDYYKTQAGDLTGFPDLTPGGSTGDGAPDDFEERDVIFARISNLVTVRSDVFTAYILVRIGADGPQKRVMAILDRSNVYSPTDKVRVVALHPVPDPR